MHVYTHLESCFVTDMTSVLKSVLPGSSLSMAYCWIVFLTTPPGTCLKGSWSSLYFGSNSYRAAFACIRNEHIQAMMSILPVKAIFFVCQIDVRRHAYVNAKWKVTLIPFRRSEAIESSFLTFCINSEPQGHLTSLHTVNNERVCFCTVI